VKKHQERQETDELDEDIDGSLSTEEDASEDERPKEKTRYHNPTRDTLRKGSQYPPLEIAAPDPSIGNAKELFRIALAGEEQLAEKMSPPGVDHRTMQELANATLDAIQLPGTSTTETVDSTGELVGALREMTEDHRYNWADDRPQKDSLWRTAGRTSLLTVKSAESLQERLSKFSGLPEEMHEIQVHRFRSILGKLHWGEGMVHAWAGSNWFLRVGKDTLEHYIALHLHLFTLSNTEGWAYAQVAVKYYATKLAQFRKTNTSRLVCLVKIYIFLRDARKSDFHSTKLQEKRNHSMLAELTTLKSGGGGGGGVGAGKGGCKKCGTDHPGGVKKCPFRNLSDTEAKKRAHQLMVKFAKLSTDEVASFLGDEGRED
jgi:hypothetical protein